MIQKKNAGMALWNEKATVPRTLYTIAIGICIIGWLSNKIKEPIRDKAGNDIGDMEENIAQNNKTS